MRKGKKLMRTGVYPNELIKIAKIIPMYKSGTKTTVFNYCPISILPIFSKDKCLMDFDKFNLLIPYHFGFMPNYATYVPLLNLIARMSSNFDANKYFVVIFWDLSKAFDVIDYCILLCKLQSCGIRDASYKWFENYLVNMFMPTILTTLLDIKCGVTQGSILGPLLFIIFANDLSNVSCHFKFLLFADDSNVIASHKSL